MVSSEATVLGLLTDDHPPYCVPGLCVSKFPPLMKTPVELEQGLLTLMASLSLSPLERFYLQYSDILRYLGLILQYSNVGEHSSAHN
jgi:hypothetical protein